MARVVKAHIKTPSTIRNSKISLPENLLNPPPFVGRPPTARPTYKNPNFKLKHDGSVRKLTWRDYSPIDLDLDFYQNPCQRSINLNFRALIWRVPNIHLFNRAEDCRLEKSKLEEFNIQCQASPECPSDGISVYIWWKNYSIEYYDNLIVDNKDAVLWEIEEVASTIDKVTFPKDEFITDGIGTKLKVLAKVKYTNHVTYRANFDFSSKEFLDEEIRIYNEQTDVVSFTPRNTTIPLAMSHRFTLASAGIARIDYESFRDNAEESFRKIRKELSSDAAYPKRATSVNRKGVTGKTTTPYRRVQSFPINSYYDGLGFKVIDFKISESDNWQISEEKWTALSFCENGEILVNECGNVPPKPPPPPKQMRCCPDNSALLKEILKIVKQNKKAIGYDNYPVTLPQSFIRTDGREKGSEKIESLTSFFAWYVQRFDEIVGEFEIPIEVEDSDLLKEGSQTVKFKLPNIAEAIAELFLMVMNINITNEVNLNVAMRTLAEAGADKQQNFKSAMMLDAIVEYLGFSYKDVVQKLPLTFTPGEEILTRILKETEVDVSVVEYDDNMNLQRALFELLQSAAIVRAKHWKQVDPKKDIKSQVLSTLLQNKDLIGQLVKGINFEDLERQINNINDEQNSL